MNNKDYYLKRGFIKDKRLVILSITRRCNLNCVYCRKNVWEWYDALSQYSDSIDLSRWYWEKLRSLYNKYNIAEILLTWWEPFEYPYLEDLMNYFLKERINFSIHTNWVSKNISKYIDMIVKNKINIHLSLELFEKHQINIRWSNYPIDLIKKLSDSKVNVELKVVLHYLMLDKINELKERIDFFLGLWVKSFRFQPVAITWSSFEKSLILKDDFTKFISELIRIKKINKYNKIIRNSTESLKTINKLLRKEDISWIANKCNMDEKIIFIDTNFKFKNCKTLWDRDLSKKCADFFDFICCWFQP